MKLWLDDDLVDRAPSEGWKHVTTAQEAIRYLSNPPGTERVTELSLDHDLGDDEIYGTGYHVVMWLAEQSFNGNDMWPDRIALHTANPSGRDRMAQVIDRYSTLKRQTSNKPLFVR